MLTVIISPFGSELQVTENQENRKGSVDTAQMMVSRRVVATTDVLGYANFPRWCDANRFFSSFLEGFKGLNGGVKEFTDLQKQIFDQLISGNHFQVTSTDVNCGSGKTTGTIGGIIGLLRESDKLVVVSRPSKGVSPLTAQLEQLSSTFSAGRVRVGTAVRADYVADVVDRSDVIVTSCVLFNEVVHAITTSLRHGDRVRTATPRVFILFDESHQLFESMSHRLMERFFPDNGLVLPNSPTSRSLFESWKLLQDIKQHHRKRMQPDNAGRSIRTLASQLEPFLSMIYRGLRHLNERNALVSHQCIFLSAGGEFTTGSTMAPSSRVIESLMRLWFDTPVVKLISQGANADSYRFTKIFRLFREGAEQIGGVSPEGYPLVYEAMIKIAFNWLVDGRLLFILRRSQLEAFCDLLDERIKLFGSYYSYTSDRDYWNATDENKRPLFNIILVIEDKLHELEGINIHGIKAVYLFSVGKVTDLLEKLQGIGRVGRIGQGYTYTFVMVDCATKRNAKIESYSEGIMLDALGTNSVCKPHVVDVMGAKVMQSGMSDIPVFRPAMPAPSKDRLHEIMCRVHQANRIQVCQFLEFHSKEGKYCCPSLVKGFKCPWYHPTGGDFTKPRALAPGRFNVKYCKKGLFEAERVVQVVPPGPQVWTTAGKATVAPWAAGAALDGKAEAKTSESVFNDMFPVLGVAPAAAAVSRSLKDVPVSKAVTAPVVSAPLAGHGVARHYVPLPVADRSKPATSAKPVCLFAVFGRMKCKNSRENRPCSFRHPEIADDAVTNDEYEVARKQALENMRRLAIKNGGKMPDDNRMPHNKPVRRKQPHVVTSEAVISNKPSVRVDPAVRKSEGVLSAAEVAVCQPSVVSPVDAEEDMVVIPPEEWKSVRKQPSNKGTPSAYPVPSKAAVPVAAPVPVPVLVPVSAPVPSGNMYSVLNIPDDHVIYLDDDEDDQSSAPATATCAPVVAVHPEEVLALRVDPAEDLRKSEESRLAVSVIQSRKYSVDLVEFVRAMHPYVLGVPALVSAILSSELECVKDHSWCSMDKFGSLLQFLLDGKVHAQMLCLYEVQKYCHGLQFPKVDTPHGKLPLIGVLFKQLLLNSVVEPEGFQSWSEDERFQDDNKATAIIQTTDFMRLVNDLIERETDEEDPDGRDASDSDAEEEVEEVVSLKMLGPGASEKAHRQTLKKERRQLRVSGRLVQ